MHWWDNLRGTDFPAPAETLSPPMPPIPPPPMPPVPPVRNFAEETHVVEEVSDERYEPPDWAAFNHQYYEPMVPEPGWTWYHAEPSLAEPEWFLLGESRSSPKALGGSALLLAVATLALMAPLVRQAWRRVKASAAPAEMV